MCFTTKNKNFSFLLRVWNRRFFVSKDSASYEKIGVIWVDFQSKSHVMTENFSFSLPVLSFGPSVFFIWTVPEFVVSKMAAAFYVKYPCAAAILPAKLSGQSKNQLCFFLRRWAHYDSRLLMPLFTEWLTLE